MRPIPADFARQRERLGGITVLARHYKAAHKTIAKWIADLGLPPLGQVGFKRVPDDFRQMAPIMSKTSLESHYRASGKVINRWLCEAGVSAATRTRGFRLSKRGCDIPQAKRNTPSDLAADYLRRFGPVSKCNIGGRFSLTGDHYRVGNVVMTQMEIIEKADRMRGRENA